MANKHDMELRRLETKISELSDTLAKLGKDKTLRDLLRIIRNPGWTTPAEFAFAHAQLDLITHLTEGLNKGIQKLAVASKQVIAG